MGDIFDAESARAFWTELEHANAAAKRPG